MPDIKPEEGNPPKAFVSYSHDSREHKIWVLEVCQKLREKGIDVILDQWDLRPGDDAAKFMERGVRDSDRVLLICSEPYVRKANDGTGGVGYEAMVVTGELIRDLGSSKFIPVFRQNSVRPILPTSVSTRFGIDLGEKADFEEQFELLLRELHQIPLTEKPPLGKNPFAVTPSGAEMPAKKPNAAPASTNDPYENALEIARAGDLVAWRRLVRETRLKAYRDLREWRAKTENQLPEDDKERIQQMLGGVSIYSPMISIAIAGVESGREGFKNQIGLLDEILFPSEWNENGRTILVRLPFAAGFVYQAVHGAMCLQTDQLPLALDMGKSKVEDSRGREGRQLWRLHEITGWPESFRTKKTGIDAWQGLSGLYDSWPWLGKAFGDKNEFLASLCAYYCMLNIHEYSVTLQEGLETDLKKQGLRLEIPLFVFLEDHEVLRRGYKLLIRNPAHVKAIWSSIGISDSAFSQHWDSWMKVCGSWLGQVTDYGMFFSSIAHQNLAKDLIGKS